MKSVMQNHFAQVPNAEIQRSQFDRSHGWKGTFEASYLVPIFIDEVLPGDTHNLNCTTFARLATPIVPLMDNMFADTFFFFVPSRLLWDNWERFNGAQTDPGDSTDYTIPVLDKSGAGFTVAVGSVADYFGIQPRLYNSNAPDINALPFRANNLIWNEWFRDQNLQDSLDKNMGDGPDAYADYPMTVRGKRYDYFTSCLPWPQKGDAVTLPLGTTAEVLRTNNATYMYGMKNGTNTTASNGAVTFSSGQLRDAAGDPVSLDPSSDNPSLTSGLYADLTNATAATINSIREAFQIQRLLERDARGGTRYVELLLSHFGVVAPDFRLQRPEYLGGASTRVNINPVAQTSSTDGTSPQGNLAGFGTFSHSGRNGFVKSFVEHGYIIGYISIRADLNYQTGLDRMWSRQTRYDFYWPALAHLGEQPVYNKEIYVAGVTATDETVFGYQERYAEYRYKRSNITGLFRSNAAGTLDYWHLAEDFDAAPALNSDFIRNNTDEILDRAIAVPSEPQFLCDIYFNLKSARPMPTYSVPGYIDRF